MATENRVVLITGAARRIGASIARHFHARGFSVLIHYRRSVDGARALAGELNGSRTDSALLLQADLTDRRAVLALGEQAAAGFGRVDVLVNNASSFYETAFAESTQQQWDDLVDSNLRAAYFLIQALSGELQKREGAIVNLVDTHADSPLLRYPIYSIAKAGLKAMTRSLSRELAPSVRVNGVSPGAILWPPSLEDANDPETAPAVQAQRQQILKGIPMGRLGSPELIAAAVWFLAVEASYVTGQVVRVDGGRGLV